MPRTWDHVFPDSWYPETTNTDIAKWKIPACEPCNKEYGALEQDLMLRLGLCIDPHAFATAGIVPKVLRSLDPNRAKNPRDRRARESKRREILEQVIDGSSINPSATYPGFGERWGRGPADQHAIKFSKRSVDRLFEKIVRGLTFVETGRFIEATHTIGIYPMHGGDTSPFTEALDAHGKVHARGPGIVVRRAIAQDDGLSGIYEIKIWGVLHTYAAVTLAET